MSRTVLEIETLLEQKIPRSVVQQRDGGGGRSLSYLSGHYVIARMNEVFGPFGWATDVKSIEVVHQGTFEKYGKPVHSVHYRAMIRLVVQGPDGIATEHTDCGYGDGSDKENIGKAHELAMKESITDGIKRCAKNLGGSMGLFLYDKDQPNVEDEPEGKSTPVSPPATVSTPGIQTRGLAKLASDLQAPEKDKKPGAPDRAALLSLIKNASSVAISLKKSTADELRGIMREKYGAEDKEQLTNDQAREFGQYLKNLNEGVKQ